MATMLPSQADALARRLTENRIRVEADERAVFLVSNQTKERIHFLQYQLTEEGIVQALADFGEQVRGQ